jgi:hypothetical protein
MSNCVPEGTRQEIKFVARHTEYHHVHRWLRLNSAVFHRPYPDRWVNNIYFDTYNCSAYSGNLLGDSSRTKVRYRWYGTQVTPAAGTFEIKKRRNHFGWKILFNVSSAPYNGNPNWDIIQRLLLEKLPREGKAWLERNPFPVIINRYHREYFVSYDKKIRITIDANQTVWDQRYKPFLNYLNRTHLPNTIVVEVKFDRKNRGLASKVLQGVPLRLSRHSKYVNAVNVVVGNHF